MGRASQQVLDEAQRLYEQEGWGIKRIGNAVGFSEASVTNWRKKHKWAAKGSKRPYETVTRPMPEEAQTTNTFTDDPGSGIVMEQWDGPTEVLAGPTQEPPEDPNVAVDREIEMLRAQLAEAQRLVAEVRPEVEVPVLTEENIDDLVPAEELRAEAEAEFASLNTQRAKSGLPMVNRDTDSYRQELERMIATKRLERLTNQTAHVPLDMAYLVASKTVKMMHPAGSMVQHIYEPQSNTQTGAVRELMHLMRDKGHRLALPQRCLLYDCYAPAATVGGQFSNFGFCFGRGHETPFTTGAIVTGTEGRIASQATDVFIGGTLTGASSA